MRALQKLIRNGNSTQFTIPRAILIHLGWLAGESMIVEVLEDESVRVRRPRESDFVNVSVKHSSRRLFEAAK